jgi:hypothetical protein
MGTAATWYAVYQTLTGELYSVGSIVANPLPAGLSSTPVGNSQPNGVWNLLTRSFDPLLDVSANLGVEIG